MYNKAILMGRITHDPELKASAGGVNYCNFRIAVERKFQQKGEEKKTDFFNIVAWRQTAEFVSRYFRKGSMILVEGELQSSKYTNKDGVEIPTTEIFAERVSFTGEKKADFSESGSTPADTGNSVPADASDDEDYPF